MDKVVWYGNRLHFGKDDTTLTLKSNRVAYDAYNEIIDGIISDLVVLDITKYEPEYGYRI